jgi:hypothetical protein
LGFHLADGAKYPAAAVIYGKLAKLARWPEVLRRSYRA